MKIYKRVFKVFVIGEEEKECKWLEKMSKEGYHLTNVSFACYYTFEKDESKNYLYMIDMKENGVDEGEYLAIYKDCDLKYIDKSKDFYYFRSKNKENMEKIKKAEQGRYADRLKSQSKLILIVGLMNILISTTGIFNTLHASKLLYIINLIVGISSIYIYYNNNKKIKNINENCPKAPYKTTLKDWNGFYPIFILCAIFIVIYGVLNLLNIIY